jgi:hypothetical protein
MEACDYQHPQIRCHIYQSIAGLAESIKRLRRGQPIYASRLATSAIDHLLLAEDSIHGRPPLGPSKREVLAPGWLTDVARTHLQFPSSAGNITQYFSEVVTAINRLIATSAAPYFGDGELKLLLNSLRQLETLIQSPRSDK